MRAEPSSMGFVSLKKRPQKTLLALLPYQITVERWFSQETKSIILDFPISRTVREKVFAVYKSPVHGIFVIAAQMN